MHAQSGAKIGRRREHARGAPNRINNISAAESVNVISDRPRKWMKNMEKVYSKINKILFIQTRGPADQYSALYFATYQYFLGIALFILAIDPLWPRIVMNNHASFRNLFFLTIATHGPYWGLHTERHAPPFLTLVVVFAEIYR